MEYIINKHENKFFIEDELNNLIAEITFYFSDDKTIVIDHTYVSDSLKGKGVATMLLDKTVEYARNENYKIVPLCSFAVKKLNESDKYKDVLK